MNNEPVAWMFQGAFDTSTYVSFEKPNPDIYPNPTPLFTHLAKTLTDEEIKELSEKHLDMDWQTGVIEFARAILRKAQDGHKN
jgi:hypothetical protein